MFERFLHFLHAFVMRKKRPVLGLVALMIIAATAGLGFYTFDGNIALMLPADEEIQRSIVFLRDSNLSDKIIISLALNSPDKGKRELFKAADSLAASLKPPLFTKVTTGFSADDVTDDGAFFSQAPQILGEDELSVIAAGINKESISERLDAIYKQSLKPESAFVIPMLRSDPLGIRLLLLERLRKLSSSLGYEVSVEDGHFISRDGRHALLIIQTSVLMTDGPGAKKLLDALEAQISLLPGYVSADVIGGHLHTVSNETVIKRDIWLTSVIATIAFLLLFVIVFPDARVALIFIIPMIAVIISISLSSLIIGRLSYLVIGFGTVIAGISTDYAMHVFIAIRGGISEAQNVKLSKLLIIDATTTVFSFLVLYFSRIEGYHQLAFFTALCVTISLVLAVFVMPLLLSWKRTYGVWNPNIVDSLERMHWPKGLNIALWALITSVALYFAPNIKFESDVKRLDGSERAVLEAEKNFNVIWGGSNNQAVFVVAGRDYEEAMERNDRIYKEATIALGRSDFTSLSMLWPSKKTRMENRERWNRFWSRGAEARLKGIIAAESPRHNFSESAFSPFFDNLYKSSAAEGGKGMADRIAERFVQKKGDEYRILSFFPDEQKYVDAMRAVSERHEGTFLVSGRSLASAISGSTSSEMKLLAPMAVIFNVALTYIFFRGFKETLISLIPVLTSIIWLVGLLSAVGLPLNVANIIATIVTSGLVVDYGIGMTYEYRHDLKAGIVLAVSLSAAVTLIGTGVLLFARHPAMFSMGVGMTVSVLSGYISSMLVVPTLCDMWLAPNAEVQKA